MTNNKTYHAAVYLRLSREDGDVADGGKQVSNSIANQKELVMDYLNSNHLSIKAQLADYAVCESGWQYADKQAEMQVASIVNNYFDIYYAQD